MKPAPFTYHRPASLDEAVELLSGLDGEARVLAGGQSLVPLMNLRLARPDHLVDIGGFHELARIQWDGQRQRVGAGVRHARLIDDPTVAQRAPLLAEAARWIGHPPTRNRGTVGGSIAHADPAAELPTVALALDAELVVLGAGGQRVIGVEGFFSGPFTTALQPGELLTEVRFGSCESWAFRELARTSGDFAVAMVAIADDRIALGAVAPTPVLARSAETAADDCDPPDDVHATAAYRRAMVGHLVAEATTDA